MRRLAAALLPALLLAASPAAADPQGWWDRDFAFRQRVALSETQAWPDSPAVRVRIATGGRCRPDAADLRVVDASGSEVPRFIAARGPGDLVEVAFPAGRGREWHVYYGNPAAEEPREAWAPDRGLLLVTRRRGPGTPDDWEGMQRILERSGPVFGGGYRGHVFDGENPYGPSDDYVSDYRGFIEAPVEGDYVFLTASDEASFLFVDGTLVAEWPGWHDAGRGAWGVFKGTIHLTPGLHSFRYVHVERTGAQAAAAYWRPPGAPKDAVIPETAFPGLRVAEVVATEARGKGLAADFTALPVGKWGLDEQVYAALLFKAALAGEGARYLWDFGDGVRGEGPFANHVYLSGGPREVTLTVRKGSDEDAVTRTVLVPDEWTRYDRNRPETLARFARLAAAYPGGALPAGDLRRAELLFAEAGRMDDYARLLLGAVEENRGLAEPDRFAFAMKLGELRRDRDRDLAGALRAFRRAAGVSDPALRARGQVALAEALLLLGGDPQAALDLLAPLLDRGAPGGPEAARRAWLRAGDARMIRGEGAEAKRCYERSLELAGGIEDPRRVLRKAGAARSALTHLGIGDLDRAQEDLYAWEWDDPLDRWRGLHPVARAKLRIAQGAPDLATRELAALLAGNRESEYADEALFLLAGIARDAGREAEAEAFLERLRRDYPWSPLGR